MLPRSQFGRTDMTPPRYYYMQRDMTWLGLGLAPHLQDGDHASQAKFEQIVLKMDVMMDRMRMMTMLMKE